jgi:vancomycin aglycone glucosyltransferase
MQRLLNFYRWDADAVRDDLRDYVLGALSDPSGVADQPYWARRVAELGIGAAHESPTPTFDSLSGALTTALAPETRARAKAVAGTIRADGATVAAKLLLDAASQERPPVSA